MKREKKPWTAKHEQNRWTGKAQAAPEDFLERAASAFIKIGWGLVIIRDERWCVDCENVGSLEAR